MKNITAAAVVQITAADFKRSVHILETETDDDPLIAELISSAVAVVDTGTAHPMAAADFEFDLPGGRWCQWWFPVRPVNSLTSVEVQDADGQWSELDLAGAYLLADHTEPRLVLADALASEVCAARAARVTANIGGSPTPQHRQAVLMMVREWFNAGISVDTENPPELAFAIRNLMLQVRYKRPRVTG
jgi:uncharacterized phiE125 gp8 family phage protein